MSNQKNPAKPFLKWAGGKTQLLSQLETRLPESIRKRRIIERYVEPFVGGGAFFFYLKNNYSVKEAYLFDRCKDLIVTYKVIQNNPDELIKKLIEKQYRYHRKSLDDRKNYYYRIRKRFNNQLKRFDYSKYGKHWIKRAAYLIFLNRTCYNGLYRLNARGEFNVPFGRYKTPNIADRKNIYAVNSALKNTFISFGDYTDSAKYITKRTLVYFDPPYRPISQTSCFTSFTIERFNDTQQEELARFYKKMDKKGAWLILSNSDPKNKNPRDDFFDRIYSEYPIERATAKRAISCKGTGRGEIKELIIQNYNGRFKKNGL